MFGFIGYLLTTLLRMQFSTLLKMQFSALLRMQEQFTGTSNGFADPWKDPIYFCEDVWTFLIYTFEDYIFWSPVLRYCCYLLPFYGVIHIAVCLRRDYLRFLSLGRGGRPSNVRGWLQNKFYQVLLVNIFRVDVFSRVFVDPLADPYNGLLYDTPTRPSPRPGIIGMCPMRQRTDGRPQIMAGIMDRFVALGLQNPSMLRFQASFLTGLPALVRHLPDAAPSGTPNAVTEWGGEIAHVRHDGSTAICLHPSDANAVIQKGWGQRNPLAVMNEMWIWRFIYHRILRTRTPLPSNMVIVYAPRNGDEEVVFNHILAAAIWWAYSQPSQ